MVGGGSSAGSRRGGGGGGGSYVGRRRIESTARVFLTACCLAGVCRAFGNALGAPFLAHEVGNGQAVFGDIGLLIVAA